MWSCRVSTTLSETLAQLTREPVFQRELVRGLSQEDTGRFIEAVTDVSPPSELVETIYAHTEGNPFFLTEVIRLLSVTMGQLDQAMAHFEDALAFCRKSGFLPELAWTCHDYAGFLLQRNVPGDRGGAIELLDESLAVSSELGMRPLMERVAALQELAESQPAKAPTYPDGLTQREVDVIGVVIFPLGVGYLIPVRKGTFRGGAAWLISIGRPERKAHPGHQQGAQGQSKQEFYRMLSCETGK